MSQKKLARIEVVADRTASSKCDEGFLRLRRLSLRNHYEDGTTSRDYPCDIVSRPGADAVAVVLWHREGSKLLVHLRRGARAAVYLRKDKKAELVQPDDRVYETLEELVAGILEAEDTGPEGLMRRGALEAHEEAGFEVQPGAVRVLGAGFFPTPGVTDEKVFLAEVEVDPAKAGAIEGDGSVMEEGASTVVRELCAAIAACRRGEILDAKTEIGLFRLADSLG
ncbi:MAG: NUDIX hydrolase, partial [Planctomycetota bacterium]